MSATWNILTFTVPGKQHILHCVPSSPLRFSKGAKTTTQLGRLHPSLWRKDPVLICRVSLLSLPRINSCSQNQSPKQKTPLSDTQTYSRDAHKSRPFHAGLNSSATFVRRVSWRQYWKWTDGTHQTRLPHSRFAGFGCARKPEQTAGRGGGGGVQESHQTFWTPQSSEADSRCQRLTEFIGPKWVCWFNMMSVT